VLAHDHACPRVVRELGVEVEAELAEKFLRFRQVFDRQVDPLVA